LALPLAVAVLTVVGSARAEQPGPRVALGHPDPRPPYEPPPPIAPEALTPLAPRVLSGRNAAPVPPGPRAYGPAPWQQLPQQPIVEPANGWPPMISSQQPYQRRQRQ
jgi:hypothetical protein